MRRFNINEFLWFLILVMFDIYIYYLISSGKIALFIHPKMHKYAMLSFIGFSILSIFQFFKIFSIRKTEKIRSGYVLFFLTIVMGGAIAFSGEGAGILENRGVNLVNSYGMEVTAEEYKEISRLALSSNTIEVTEKNYKVLLKDINDNLQSYKGKKIILEGLVYKEEEFEKDEFVISRMMLSCCVADAENVGFLCNWKNVDNLKAKEWVKIEGIIDSKIYEYKGIDKKKNIPYIRIDKIEKLSKPENSYIYR